MMKTTDYGQHRLILFLLITKGVVMEYSELQEDTWIHFDNKYHLYIIIPRKMFMRFLLVTFLLGKTYPD